MDVLKAMEKVATDEKDKPVEDIKILETQIYLNPFRFLFIYLYRLFDKQLAILILNII
jgi:hypothetical protein